MKSFFIIIVTLIGIISLPTRISAQSKFIYRYTCKLPTSDSTYRQFNKSVNLQCINDSTFTMDGLFYKDTGFRYFFKVENSKWFLKYDSDWMLFFNNENLAPSSKWNIKGIDMVVIWHKTNIVDHTDSVYVFNFFPLHNFDNPLQVGDGISLEINTSDAPGPYYFTFSSGIIAFGEIRELFFLREDKMHLEVFFIANNAVKSKKTD